MFSAETNFLLNASGFTVFQQNWQSSTFSKLFRFRFGFRSSTIFTTGFSGRRGGLDVVVVVGLVGLDVVVVVGLVGLDVVVVVGLVGCQTYTERISHCLDLQFQ